MKITRHPLLEMARQAVDTARSDRNHARSEIRALVEKLDEAEARESFFRMAQEGIGDLVEAIERGQNAGAFKMAGELARWLSDTHYDLPVEELDGWRLDDDAPKGGADWSIDVRELVDEILLAIDCGVSLAADHTDQLALLEGEP